MKETVLDVLMYLFECFVDSEDEPEPDRKELREELERAGFRDRPGRPGDREGEPLDLGPIERVVDPDLPLLEWPADGIPQRGIAVPFDVVSAGQ